MATTTGADTFPHRRVLIPIEQYAHTTKPSLKKHCESLSGDRKKAAEQAREMAKLHHALAQKVGKQQRDAAERTVAGHRHAFCSTKCTHR